MDIRHEIERILNKDLPWTITCSCCERDFDLELDFESATDDLEALLKSLQEGRQMTKTSQLLNGHIGYGQLDIKTDDKTIRTIKVHLGRDGKWHTGNMLLSAYLESVAIELSQEIEGVRR